MQRKQLIPSKFAHNSHRASSGLPIRILEVDIDETLLGTNVFEDAVRLACIAVKQAEQFELETIYARMNLEEYGGSKNHRRKVQRNKVQKAK